MSLFAPLIEAINKKSLPQPAHKQRWVEASDRISVHAKGIRPQFKNPRKNGGTVTVTPASYEPRYKYLFDSYILNRHPNEAEAHYNWRLSTFPLIAQEIYLNAKSQILGAIFQTSQFELKSNDEVDNDYLDSIGFKKWFTEELPHHVFTDPYGLVAIVEGHNGDFPATEKALPKIEMVESRYILSYEVGISIVFRSADLRGGKKVIYFLDQYWSVTLVEGEDADQYDVIHAYPHGMNALPILTNESFFFQSYVSWADMLARNISDDESIAKDASYPIREIVAPKCNRCMGKGKAPVACEISAQNPNGFREGECPDCNGKGTISINPGDTFYTKERESNDQRPQIDRVKYYNPDISINDFSFKRWKEIYDFGMRSMHMKFIEAAQSGEAKAYDRDQLHYLLVNVKNKLFEIGSGALKFIVSYRRLTTPAKITNIVEDAPQQFQIKTEYDIQEEYTDLLSKGADVMVRRTKLNEYMNKAWSGNVVALRTYTIIKIWDFLYGMTDTELTTRKLLGSATTEDFVKHDRAQTLIENLILQHGEDWLLNSSIEEIINQLDKAVKPFFPKAGVIMPGIEEQ
jgi:hypothetical protein